MPHSTEIQDRIETLLTKDVRAIYWGLSQRLSKILTGDENVQAAAHQRNKDIYLRPLLPPLLIATNERLLFLKEEHDHREVVDRGMGT